MYTYERIPKKKKKKQKKKEERKKAKKQKQKKRKKTNTSMLGPGRHFSPALGKSLFCSCVESAPFNYQGVFG